MNTERICSSPFPVNLNVQLRGGEQETIILACTCLEDPELCCGEPGIPGSSSDPHGCPGKLDVLQQILVEMKAQFRSHLYYFCQNGAQAAHICASL